MDGGGKVLVAGTGIPLSDSEEGTIQKEKKKDDYDQEKSH